MIISLESETLESQSNPLKTRITDQRPVA